MSDPQRVQHRYDENGDYCVRCLASRIAIEDGFVNMLCGGQPVTHTPVRMLPTVDAAWNRLERAVDGPEGREALEDYIRAIVREEVR